MAGGYDVPTAGEFGELQRRLRELERRTGVLEAPTGSQTAETLVTLKALVEDLVDTVNSLAASGVTWAGPVDTTGTVNAAAGVSSVGAYSNLLTASYRALWVTNTGGSGSFGYVPSSAQFKQDIESAQVPAEVWRALRLVTFRYIAAVADEGEQARTEWGLIAEEVHALGLTWLVDYDDEGRPFGVKREQLALVLVSAVQQIDARMDSVEGELQSLRSMIENGS